MRSHIKPRRHRLSTAAIIAADGRCGIHAVQLERVECVDAVVELVEAAP